MRQPLRKLRILVLAANPGDKARLDLEREVKIIKDELDDPRVARRVRIDVIWSVTPEDFARKLETFRPDVLHFAGHGNARGEPVLVSPDYARSSPAPYEFIRDAVADAAGLRCIVFSACHSVRLSQRLIDDFPVVTIAVRDLIEDQNALEFCKYFYRFVARGFSVQKSFDRAVRLLRTEQNPDADLYQINSSRQVDRDSIALLGFDWRAASVWSLLSGTALLSLALAAALTHLVPLPAVQVLAAGEPRPLEFEWTWVPPTIPAARARAQVTPPPDPEPAPEPAPVKPVAPETRRQKPVKAQLPTPAPCKPEEHADLAFRAYVSGRYGESRTLADAVIGCAQASSVHLQIARKVRAAATCQQNDRDLALTFFYALGDDKHARDWVSSQCMQHFKIAL